MAPRKGSTPVKHRQPAGGGRQSTKSTPNKTNKTSTPQQKRKTEKSPTPSKKRNTTKASTPLKSPAAATKETDDPLALNGAVAEKQSDPGLEAYWLDWLCLLVVFGALCWFAAHAWKVHGACATRIFQEKFDRIQLLLSAGAASGTSGVGATTQRN